MVKTMVFPQQKPIPLTFSHDLSRGASGSSIASGGRGDGRDAATDAGRGAAKKRRALGLFMWVGNWKCWVNIPNEIAI